MRLEEILTIAKDTDLKQIIVGEQPDQVMSLLNLALIDVYGRFDLIQEEQIIKLENDKTRYPLLAESQRVLSIYDDDGELVPVNDNNDTDSVFMPTPFLLHVTEPETGKTLSLIHSITPPFITSSNISTVDFIVPPALLEPIVAYMAYRAYLSMNGDAQTENVSQYKRYDRAVNDVYKRGLVGQHVITNLKGKDRGFPS